LETQLCYCGSLQFFKNCCSPYINGVQKAPTALALMKSRYSAYAAHQAEYLWNTTYICEQKNYSKTAILLWATANKWQQLEIINYSENTVEFKAYFLDHNNKNQIHHEFSTFKKENGSWFYLDGKFPDE